ncbi:cadherin domain protein [Cooperia oncophora]
MQVVDNWPTGIIVDRLKATDMDSGKNARVVYSLASGNSKYFSIDPLTGELTVSGELAGAAREQPYELVVLAEDAGSPSLSSSVRIKLKVSEPLLEKEGEKGQVIFLNPPVEFVLKLKEDIPVNEHVYIVKARLAGIGSERMNIKYSLRDSMHSLPSQQHFDIDESSGEVYVTKALDYEDTKFYTMSCENEPRSAFRNVEIRCTINQYN